MFLRIARAGQSTQVLNNKIGQAVSAVEDPTFIDADGGTETTSGDYKIHTYNSSANFVVNSVGNGDRNVVEYLVIAGGGGGYCGGGGAGGMLTGVDHEVSVQTYAITVGAGGYSGQCNVNGHGNAGMGGNSVFDTITSPPPLPPAEAYAYAE